jgi:hypothetical protein
MHNIFNAYIVLVSLGMIALMIGIPVPTLNLKRSQRLASSIVGWNTALVFFTVLILAVTRN